MPKGVPRSITRALRLGQKKPGQFLDYRNAFLLRDALRTYYKPAPRRKAPKAKPPKVTTPEPGRFFDFEEPERPTPPRKPREPGVVEWEIGIDYKARRGSDSNVAFNARFYRADREPMMEDEARDVLRHIIYHGEAPPGIVVQEVYWQRRKGAHKRYGRPRDMVKFFDILATVGDDGMHTTPFRMGATKPDRI
jgi:hypothetical protein